MPDDAPKSSSADDARLLLVETLLAVGRDDARAFERLYRLTAAKLFGICLLICGDRQAAEDVLQDVYATVWRRAGAFEPGRASPISWLAAIARNRAIDWRRSQGSRAWVPAEQADAVPDERPDARDALLANEGERRLLACMDRLDPQQAAVIRQAFFGGMTYAALAEHRGVPLGTMKSWVRRGLLRLRRCLEEV